MTMKLLGQKKGMAQIFDKDGKAVACTVIEVMPNPVVQIKRLEKEGYSAVQLAGIPLSKARQKNASKSVKGHYAKANVPVHTRITESRCENTDQIQVGQAFGLSTLEGVAYVDVQGVTKGKGFQGVMKLHGFAGGPAAHGSGFHRHAGSTGQRSTPGRCFPNGKRASRMGGDLQTTQNLRVVSIQGNVLLVEGATPGSRGAVLCITQAEKKQKKLKK